MRLRSSARPGWAPRLLAPCGVCLPLLAVADFKSSSPRSVLAPAVNIKGVGIQVALMSGISLATILAFSFFRPRERKVYAPKVKYRAQDEEDDPPPPISNGFFSWLTPLLSQGDKDLVHTIGPSALLGRGRPSRCLQLLIWPGPAAHPPPSRSRRGRLPPVPLAPALVLSLSLPARLLRPHPGQRSAQPGHVRSLLPAGRRLTRTRSWVHAAVVWTLKDGSDSAKANKLNLLTLAGLSGNILFVHVGSSYLISQSAGAVPF